MVLINGDGLFYFIYFACFLFSLRCCFFILFLFFFVCFCCTYKGGHGRRNISADLQMVAHYAAQVVSGTSDVSGSHASSSHSPEHQYRPSTANGNSVSYRNEPFGQIINVCFVLDTSGCNKRWIWFKQWEWECKR